VIVVTGMHRSGTSMFAQLLARLGVDFGAPTGFSADRRRLEAGYTEHDDVIDINSELVTGFPRHGGAVTALMSQVRYTTMPGPAAIRRRAAARARRLEQVASRYANLAVKDVRFCLTLSAWRQVVPVDKVVVCLRHPTEVARSLHKRQRYPIWLGYRFWDYHIRSLLEQLDGLPALYVRFEALTGGGYREELERLAAFLPLDVPEDERERVFRGLFDPNLRHHQADPEDRLPETTRALWAELLARHGAQGDPPAGAGA
jgi:hypothetical protein